MDLSWLLVFALLLLALALALGWWWAARRWSRASRARVRRALDGEQDAESLLAALGYRVRDRQVRALGWMEIDGESVEFEVRADLLVEVAGDGPGLPRGAVLVAEVKTGARATDPAHPATRRQLLEYQRVFQPDGLLLVDVEAGQVVEVAFPE
jgi:hypothetical protein